MTWPKKTYLPLHCELCAAMGAHNCGTRWWWRLVTFDTLITILTIENLNSWQFLLYDHNEWQWTAFAILAMFFCKNWPIWLVNLVVLVGVRLSGHHISPVLVPKMAKNKFCELGNPPILGKIPKKCLFFSVTRRSRSDVVYWLTDG